MSLWAIALNSKDDLEGFYDDMETPGGILPDAIDCQLRKPTSRITYYELTDEQAETIRADSRVYYVEKYREPDMEIEDSRYLEPLLSTIFDKDDYQAKSVSSGAVAHAIWRHRNRYNDYASVIDDWHGFFPGTFRAGNLFAEQFQNETGKNVDIVIIDGHLDPNIPDLAVNDDGTGGSRVVQENWHTYTPTVQGLNGGVSSDYFMTTNYTYSPYTSGAPNQSYNQHGAACATVAAGWRCGQAPRANIYNFGHFASVHQFYAGVVNSLYPTMFDYIRVWHESKPINPATGCRNPTILSCSWGFGTSFDEASGEWPHYAENPRGNGGTSWGNPSNTSVRLTNQEMEDAQIMHTYQISGTSPNRTGFIRRNNFETFRADIEDCIEAGIHICMSAGNEANLTKNRGTTAQAQAFYRINGVDYFSHGKGWGTNDCICVGNLSTQPQVTMPNGLNSGGAGECPSFETNRGEGVDFYATGHQLMSGANASTTSISSSYPVADPRNTSYYFRNFGGTSSATPVIAGLLACILERYPDLSPAQAKEYLTSISGGLDNNEVGDDGRGWPGDQPSPNSGSDATFDNFSFEAFEDPKMPILNKDIRPAEGRIETRTLNNFRRSTGRVFPRPRTSGTRRNVV